MIESEKIEFKKFCKKFPESKVKSSCYIYGKHDENFEKLSSKEKLRQIKNIWIRGDVNK